MNHMDHKRYSSYQAPLLFSNLTLRMTRIAHGLRSSFLLSHRPSGIFRLNASYLHNLTLKCNAFWSGKFPKKRVRLNHQRHRRHPLRVLHDLRSFDLHHNGCLDLMKVGGMDGPGCIMKTRRCFVRTARLMARAAQQTSLDKVASPYELKMSGLMKQAVPTKWIIQLSWIPRNFLKNSQFIRQSWTWKITT